MVFSNFFNFYAIFLEFSITGREETQRNDCLPLLSFVAFPKLFQLVKKLRWCFLIFFIFMLCFQNFQLRVGKKHNGTIFYIFSLSQPFPTYFGLKRSYDGIFKIFEFFCYYFGTFYYGSGRNTTERFFLFAPCRGLS